jgi:porin
MRRLHSHSLSVAAILFAFGALVGTRGFAQDTVKTYSGDFLTRSTLTGDWLGYRNDLLAKGITFDAYVTQVEQGVVSGGKNGSWEYGGRGDLTGNLDTGKAGLWPGGFLTAELEGNWESSVNPKTGALEPADTTQLFPVPGSRDVALSNLSFAQFFSHYIGISLGKFDVIPLGDNNAFAHGKGDSQFLNLAFNADPVLLVVPYSTLAVGALILPTADPDDCILKVVVASAKGKATTSGFDDFDGALFWSEIRKRIEVFDLMGHQLVGGLYSNRNYTSLDQRLSAIIGNQQIAKHDGTWSVYYNFDQYLYEPKKGVDQGVGVFGRFGASQGNPNPAQYFYSIGLGGKGFIPTREHDQAGLGYYYISIRNPTLAHPRGTTSFLRDEWGFEGYYNLALTPWLLLTPDVQVIGPSQKTKFVSFLGRQSIGTATVLGVRLQVLL